MSSSQKSTPSQVDQIQDNSSASSTKKQQQQPVRLSQQALNTALTSTAQLANLLPTGTLLAFQLLTPVFTKNGTCDAVTRFMTQSLLIILASSCFFASFTDSFRSSDGQLHYGFATLRGMWLFDCDYVSSTSDEKSKLPDLSKYRLRVVDFVHAVLSVLVFGSVALRDRNVVSCFYPVPGKEAQEVLDILPIGVGVIAGLLFCVLPTRRHGIGFPVTSGNDNGNGKTD